MNFFMELQQVLYGKVCQQLFKNFSATKYTFVWTFCGSMTIVFFTFSSKGTVQVVHIYFLDVIRTVFGEVTAPG